MINIDRVIKAVSEGISERAGCADGEKKRTNDWIKLAHSKKSSDHDQLIKEITDHCY